MLADQVGLDFFGIGEHHRGDFAVSAPEIVLAAIAEPHAPAPPGLRGDGAELGRPDPHFPTLLDARRGVRRARRGDPRPRLVHRVVSVVRLRPRRIRDAVRGQARPVRGAAAAGAGHMAKARRGRRSRRRRCSRRSRPGRSRPGSASAAARTRWSAPRATTCRSCWRSSAATRPGSGPTWTCITGRSRSSAGRCGRSACIRRATSPRPTRRRGTSCGRPSSRCGTGSAPSAGGRRCGGPSSTARPIAARCMWARRRRSPARSPAPCGRSVCRGST